MDSTGAPVRESITGERRRLNEATDESWFRKNLSFSNIAVVAGVVYTVGIQVAKMDALEERVRAAETTYVRQDVYNAERLALANALIEIKAELAKQREDRQRRGGRP